MLYLAPVLLAGGIWGVISVLPKKVLEEERSWLGVDYASIKSVQLLRDYLRIDTSAPDGNEIPGAELLASWLEAEGIEVHLERLGNRNANLWAILEGEDPRALVLHSHLDVDPAPSPESWKHPPFAGVIDVPWIFGRGTFDMKSVTIAQVLAMIELKRKGLPLQRSLILLATGDEETGSHLGTRWILREHPELVERFWGVLTEGGAIEALEPGRVKYWGTEIWQKRLVIAEACSGSRERLEDLRSDLLEHRASREPRPRLLPTVADFLRIYAASRDMQAYRELLMDLEILLAEDHPPSLPPFAAAQVDDEIEVFKVRPDPAGGYRLRIVLHLLPDVELEQGWNELVPAELRHGVEIGIVYDVAPLSSASPTSHPLFAGIEKFFATHEPEVDHGPLVVPWTATDARFFRAQGIPAYGFTPFVIISVDTFRMSGVDERIALPAFVEGVELYRDMVEHLVTPSSP